MCDEPLLAGSEITLSDDEARHLKNVLRLKEGDAAQLFDGEGVLAEAHVTSVAKKVTLRIEEVAHTENPFKIHLAFGISKGNALEFVIKRVSELGVRSFQPLLTDHSLHPDEWNEERWNRVAVEVAKQCQALFVPRILKPVALGSWLSQRPKRDLVVCDELSRAEKPQGVAGEVDLIVGAEGGWSEEERALFKKFQGYFLGLGPNRLRTETATLTAVLLLKVKLGEI